MNMKRVVLIAVIAIALISLSGISLVDVTPLSLLDTLGFSKVAAQYAGINYPPTGPLALATSYSVVGSNAFTASTANFVPLAAGGAATTTSDARNQLYAVRNCTANSLYFNVGVRGTLAVYTGGTSTTVTFVFNTSNTAITISSSDIFTHVGPVLYTDTAHTANVVAGQIAQILVTDGNFSTPPTTVDIGAWVGCQ